MTEKTDESKPQLRAVEGGAEEQAPQDEEALFAHMAQQVFFQLRAAMPFSPPPYCDGDDGMWSEVASFLTNEQLIFNGQVLPRLADPAEQSPTIAIEFVRMKGDGEGMRMTAPRSIVGNHDINTAVRLAMIYALMDSPVARAILRTNGFAYRVTFPGHQPLVVL